MNTNNEQSLLNQPIIYDLTKFTTTDYADHLSCIVWFAKCNMRCLYCYNDALVYSNYGKYTVNDLLNFLSNRRGLLECVVLSGGEATLNNLTLICKKIKELGYKIKLDTNGLNPNQLKSLIQNHLIDFVALDYKAPQSKFEKITQTKRYDDFETSLRYLIESNCEFEVRTTYHSKLITIEDINEIIHHLCSLGYKNSYYIQNFLETETNIGDIHSESDNLDISKIDTSRLTVIHRD